MMWIASVTCADFRPHALSSWPMLTSPGGSRFPWRYAATLLFSGLRRAATLPSSPAGVRRDDHVLFAHASPFDGSGKTGRKSVETPRAFLSTPRYCFSWFSDNEPVVVILKSCARVISWKDKSWNPGRSHETMSFSTPLLYAQPTVYKFMLTPQTLYTSCAPCVVTWTKCAAVIKFTSSSVHLSRADSKAPEGGLVQRRPSTPPSLPSTSCLSPQ